MIYEVKKLSDEELQRLYILESSKLLAVSDRNISHNSLQSLKLTLFHLDSEIEKRNVARLQRA